jgi:hypothetical protein
MKLRLHAPAMLAAVCCVVAFFGAEHSEPRYLGAAALFACLACALAVTAP